MFSPATDALEVVITDPGTTLTAVVDLLHDMFGPVWADDERESWVVCASELAATPNDFHVSGPIDRDEAEAQAAKLRAVGATVELRGEAYQRVTNVLA